MSGLPKGCRSLTTNKVLEISKKDMEGKGLFTSIVGHLGDGNFHEAIFYNKSDPVETAMVSKVVHDMIDRALEMEGTCTVSSPLAILYDI